MILKWIRVKGLKAIKQEKTIGFSPGLNIIKGGDNEAGKSSLRIAITKALFQDPATTREDVLGLTSWGTDEPWEVELEFQTDSESYRITKRLRDGSCELVDIGSSKTIATNKNLIAAKIAEITGCPSEVFFESTACIGQEEFIGIIPQGATRSERQKAVGDITKRLQATLSGAEGTDVPAILARLYDKTHRKDARGPYWHLQGIVARMEELQSEKVAQETKVNKVMESRRQLNTVKEELEQISKDLPPKQEVVEKNRKIFELEKEITRDKTQYESFSRAKRLKSDLDSLDREPEQFACFMGAEEKMETLKHAQSELQGLENQRAGLQGDMETLQGQKPPLWMLVLGLALMVAVVGVFLLGYWLIRQTAWSRRMKVISEEIAELERQMLIEDQVVKGFLNSFGFVSYDECLRRFREYGDKIGERKTLADKLSGIVGDRGWDQFEEENADLVIRVSSKQNEHEQLLPFKMNPLDLQELDNKVRSLQERKDFLESDKSGLERFFQYTDVDTDQLASIEEELKWLEEEQEFWETKRKLFEITRDTLDEAHKQTLSEAADVLKKELGRYISIITDGRYNQAKIDEGDLSIWTFSPEKGDWVNVLELSRATQDQFYISARFALVKLITEGKGPPLLLDDPFVNFHPKRLKRSISLLQELAKENQILLFTCSDAYDDCGNVILLD